jgi:hypothetical protein
MDEHETQSPKRMPSQYLDEDFTMFTEIVESKYLPLLEDISWDTYIGVAHGIEIPQTLLVGPWTEETTRHLYWMVKSGAQLEWVTSTIGEVSSCPGFVFMHSYLLLYRLPY